MTLVKFLIYFVVLANVSVHGIYDGICASGDQFTFTVRVKIQKEYPYIKYCGGTLINCHTVLTDSSCTDEAVRGIVIEAGDLTDLSTTQNGRVIKTADFWVNHCQSNLALIFFKNPIKTNNYVTVDKDTAFDVGHIATMLGTGSNGIPPSTCLRYANTIIQTVTASKITTKSYGLASTCSNDYGGPLVVIDNSTYYEVGLLDNFSGDCRNGATSLYTRAAKFYDWIFATIETTFVAMEIPLNTTTGCDV